MVTNLVDRLNDEWSLLAGDTTELCVSWSSISDPLAGCCTPADVLRSVRHSPDVVLGFLLGRYRDLGEVLAGRIVLQSMLGKLVRMSYTATAAAEPHAVDDLVTHMWCQIASYPLARRPHSIAANLALDTLKAAQHEWRRAGEVPAPPASVASMLEVQEQPVARDVIAEIPWSAETIITAAFELSLITETTRDVLIAVYGDEGLTGAAAARRWQCSPSAIRTRCRTAVKEQLAPLAHQLLLAA